MYLKWIIKLRNTQVLLLFSHVKYITVVIKHLFQKCFINSVYIAIFKIILNAMLSAIYSFYM